MQFKHPEILYFLIALLIPIFVHLFQLQKFKKTAFTNVAFLQKIALQTRKSSRIKKWLILMTRLLLFSAIIFAFSQPYFSENTLEKEQQHFIYLDNSLSLNSKGEKGNLLQNNINELIKNIPSKETYSLLTNDHFYKNMHASELKEILLKLKPTPKSKHIEEVLLTIKNENNNKINTSYNNYLISDFQNNTKNRILNFTNVTSPISFIQSTPKQKKNISIDSVFISNQSTLNFTIHVVVKNQGTAKKNIPIAIFNAKKITSKQTVSIAANTKKTVSFPIQKKQQFNGKINIDFDDAYAFDNVFYFTVNSSKKTTVLSIGNTAKFLSKIYTKKEFKFTTTSLKNTNYNAIEKQELIVLNELKEIPKNLATYLKQHLASEKSIVIIPNVNLNINSYNSFFKEVTNGVIKKQQNDTLKITTINFKHPFFKNVFTKNIRNFQYPFALNNTSATFKKSNALISFENNQSFINQLQSNNGTMYWLSSALNRKNSNFTNSPLIVPLFYNFGKRSLKYPKAYYIIGNTNEIDITTSLQQNEVVTIGNATSSFIPQQQAHQHKVTLTTTENPTVQGIYSVRSKNNILENIAFNYPKSESNLDFLDIKNLIRNNKNIRHTTSIRDAFQEQQKKNEVTWFWKWFLWLAIVSLFFEILILKLFKP